MFESLSERLGGVFDRLRGRGALNEADVRAAMREVRIALLEADVALPVVREFVDKVTEEAVGQSVLRSITPGQQVVKIVNDALVEMLGAEASELKLDVTPPAVVMMVGLQGSGKTTTHRQDRAAPDARRGAKKVLMASLDVNRPAAQEQLAVLGTQAEVATLPIVAGPAAGRHRPARAAGGEAAGLRRADARHRRSPPRRSGADGRDEGGRRRRAARTKSCSSSTALTGQDAVNVAKSFSEQVPLTGVVLTRMDGDARGGAALSMRAVTGKPIKFVGTGEKLDGLEAVPARAASPAASSAWATSSSLVERAAETIKQEEAEKLAERMAKGQFDLNDLRDQLNQMRRMGGLGALAGMLPGVDKVKSAMATGRSTTRSWSAWTRSSAR